MMGSEATTGTEGTAPGVLVLSDPLPRAAPVKAGQPKQNTGLNTSTGARSRAGRRDGALGLRLFLVLLAFTLVAAGFSLKLRPLSLPVWAVAEVEVRMNRMIDTVLPEAGLSLGGLSLMLDESWSPVLKLEDLRLLQARDQATFLGLPEAVMVVDGRALWSGNVLPQSLRISGAHLDLRRDLDGRINILFGQGKAPAIQSLSELFDRIDDALALPELADLQTIEFEGLSLSLSDARAGRTWDLGDGRLVAQNRADALAAELTISVLGAVSGTPRARLTAIAAKGAGEARITAEVSDIPARDLAAQHSVLAWLGGLDAPISGQLQMNLHRGGIDGFDAQLSLGAGALQPTPDATAIAFSKAGLKLSYDPKDGRLSLSNIEVESATLRARARGQVYLLDAAGQIQSGTLSGKSPAAFLAQLQLDDLRVDPEGLFETPVHFGQGALDLRMTPDPFSVEIGQFSLSEGRQHLSLKGTASAQPGGWAAALDVAMNEVTVKRLMQLWPVRLVPKTRAWAGQNLLTGNLTDVDLALRLAPGTEPRLHLDYDFKETEIRFMATMPPVTGGEGYSVIDGKVNTVVLAKGQVTAPQGGVLDISGSSLTVPDIYAIPARGEFSLRARGPAEAALSILNQKPFEYLKKAGRPVALGQGDAVIGAEFSLPLSRAILPGDVAFTARARVRDFASSVLVEGYDIVVPDLLVTADPQGMVAQGQGTISTLPFDGRYTLPFKADGGVARVSGTVEVSPRTVDVFDLGLPKGMVKGKATGTVDIALPRGAAPELTLTSDLRGAVLAIPELGWSKGASAKGRLEVEARLSQPPVVSRLSLSGPQMSAEGKAAFRKDGRLDVAKFSRVTLGGWLDGAVEIKGSNPLAFAITSGAIDFREFPDADQRASDSVGASGSPVTMRLDQFRVADSIILRRFNGDFRLGNAGVNGQFTALLNGEVPISGGVAPDQNGTAVRVVANDAGAAFKAAGLFDSAHGGTLDLSLTPQTQSGIYTGRATISQIRVRNANVLAELLNAISVIGMLEQLNGSGIVFNQAEADFVLSPTQVTITKSSAVGASLGVSMEGTYFSADGRLKMGGVVSPIYLLNGIGAILTRKGEGLFGFSYRLNGTADNPEVGVNPLSILTPGMFRDIFRIKPPTPQGDAG